jgi:hypothetical protein
MVGGLMYSNDDSKGNFTPTKFEQDDDQSRYLKSGFRGGAFTPLERRNSTVVD